MTLFDTPEPPPLAPLPEGAPTFARHLHMILSLIEDNALMRALMVDGDCLLTEAGRVAVAEAKAAVAALPSAPPPTKEIDEEVCWRTEDGVWQPERLIKDAKLLEDAFVRTVVNGALATRKTLARLKAITLSESEALLALLAAQHGVELGGKGGNVSYYTFDRSHRVQVSRQERLTVNATIEVARQALSEWLHESEASAEVKALIEAAFGIGDQGTVRINELIRLRRLKITHPKWKAAMAAIDEAIETAGKAIYLRIYERQPDGRYALIPLDLASA